ncbi:MAG: hypothetical protein B7733_21760 [Myxococcales bacterium FL481]|nr:MAG: hypothetical protein B7733_21760 [Myxococcales bacterium FL481]
MAREPVWWALHAQLLSCLFVVTAGCGEEDQTPVCEDILPTTTPREADVSCLDRWLVAERSWPEGAQASAEQALAALSEEAERLSDAEFYLRVSEIVAFADNAHSGLRRAPIRQHFGRLPIRTYWFEDGLVVVRAGPGHTRLLGAKILRIAGLTPTELMAAMQRYSGDTDEGFRVYETNWLFLSPALLFAAGLSPSPAILTLTVQLTAGDQEVIHMVAAPATESDTDAYPHRLLHPDPLAEESPGWLSWLGEAQTNLPWSLDEPEDLFRYRLMADRDVAHVQFRSNASPGGVEISGFVDQVKRCLKRDRPRYVLWDQRYNPGGSADYTSKLARRLHRWLPRRHHVYVLTSHATFSAGIYTAFYPEWKNDGRTTVVGTRAGDKERFWAEMGPPVVLPETGWGVSYARQMHDVGDGCHDENICNIRRRRLNLAVGSINPDVRIPELASDVLEGRDAVVDWVLSEID